ncbi:hypothetical protein MRX96_027720 [Rhipicephalus microplus]
MSLRACSQTRRYRGPRHQAASTHAVGEGQPPTDGLRRHLAAVAEAVLRGRNEILIRNEIRSFGASGRK